MKKHFIFFLIVLNILQLISSSQSESCKTDSDCISLNYCDQSTLKCLHNPIFSNVGKELFGLLSVVLGSALSNAGGIGGGGLLIPILLLIMNFYTHEAIPISKLMIFTGALTSFFLGFRQKHPTRKSITIDYNIPLLLVPLLLFGTMVGVTLNKVTPPWIILTSLTLVLIINTYKTLKKGKSLYEIENKRRTSSDGKDVRVLHNFEESKSIEIQNLDVEENADKSNKNNNKNWKENKNRENKEYADREINNVSRTNESNEELLAIEEIKDLDKFPLEKIKYMFFCYVIMLLVNFLKGSDYMKSIIGVEICSGEYWIIYFIFFPFAMFVTYIVANKIRKEYEYRSSIGYPYNSTDIKWSSSSIFIKFPLYAFISGLMAGLLGIGGGLILGPLLLELGLHPLGMMNRDFGIACTLASTVGSFVGTVLLQKLIERTGRNSYIIFALGAVLGVSTLLIPIHTLIQLIDSIKEGKSIWSFNKPC